MEGGCSAQVAGKAGGTGSQLCCFSRFNMEHSSQRSPLFLSELNSVSFQHVLHFLIDL